MEKHKKLIIYFITALLLIGFVLLFSTTTSPLFPNYYGVDSAFNRFMGLMVLRGKVLYSEIWDNKGPVLFFLQAIGTLKGTHNADITLTFLMQIASIFLTFFLVYRAVEEASHGKISIPSTIILALCALSVFAIVIDSGNLSEEWSLPMIACSLYLLVKYAANVKDHPLHPRKYAFIHGICFGLLAFIRVNNAISICAGLLAAAVYLAFRRKWRNLFENILFGLLGIALVAVPVCLYFLSKHALGEMLYGVFFYNIKYASQRTHKTFTGTDFLDRFLPIIASLLIIFIHWIRTRNFRLLDGMMLMIVAINAVMLWNSNIFLHYYIIFVPVFLLVMLLYADFRKIPEMAAALIVLAFFTFESVNLLSAVPALRELPDRFAFAASIPEEEKRSAMGLYVSPEVYLNSGLIPCSRFAAYHFAHFPVDPAMKDEFLHDMTENPPFWIIYLSGYEGIITEVQELLEEKYDWVTDEYGATYYRIKNSE